MTSFLIGKILEPEEKEVKTKNGKTSKIELAILSGRCAVPFTVWQDSNVYDSLASLNDGDLVCAIVGDGIDSKGRITHYLNRVAPCDADLRQMLLDLF